MSARRPKARLTLQQHQDALNDALNGHARPNDHLDQSDVYMVFCALIDSAEMVNYLRASIAELEAAFASEKSLHEKTIAERNTAEDHLRKCRARCERMRTMEGLPLDECAARQLHAEQERDAAKAGAERLKAELAAEENNCPYPDFSCGTFAAERGIELRPAGGPTYTTTSDHWQGILRDLEAAKAGEARAVEALRKVHFAASYVAEECNEDDWTVDQQAMLDLHEALDAVDVEEPEPALDWLAQREREAVVAELRDWAERWWESFSDFSAGDFNQRIAAVTTQQPTACPREEK
jgi:hypothetical protein